MSEYPSWEEHNELKKELNDHKQYFYEFRDFVKDWQADKHTELEVLKTSLSPIIEGYPTTKEKVEKITIRITIWASVVATVVGGVVTIITGIIIAAFGE